MMGQLILNALIAESNAKEAKSIANLNAYMTNAAGIGEHPDVVAECSKLVKDIAEAREMRSTVNSLIQENNNNQNKE
jgi:hypothetical protein